MKNPQTERYAFEFILFRREVPINSETKSNGEHEQMMTMMEQKGFELVGRKISLLPGQGIKPSFVATLRTLFLDEVLKE